MRRMTVRALRRPSRGRRRLSVFLLGLALIAGWQRDVFTHPDRLDERFVIVESNGINEEWRFLYFLYYTGLYPVVAREGHARLMQDPEYRRFRPESARRVLAERGETLYMEWGQTIRAGDMGRAFLYLPHAIWTGSARDPRMAPTHAVAFTIALWALWAAFWWARDPVLGASAVALLGSNPFQLYAVHVHENVFGWAITAGVVTLAVCLPLLSRRPAERTAWVLVILAGAVLGTVRQIRPEPVTILASVALAGLLSSRTSWTRRLLRGALAVAAFTAAAFAWQAFFDFKFEQARKVVSAAGGTTYQGPRDRHHTFWHPLWCGLGDFDRKHGYKWSDAAAKQYARPILRERYRAMGRVPDERFIFWDPVYEQILKEKVMRDITHDPLWFAGILGRRVLRVLEWTTPVRLSVGGRHLDLPWSGMAAAVLVAVLALLRSWPLVKLALFPLGTSLAAILVFTGTVPGQTYTGWFHIMGAALALAALFSAAAELVRRPPRRRRAPGA
jgi:hypothetical protein